MVDLYVVAISFLYRRGACVVGDARGGGEPKKISNNVWILKKCIFAADMTSHASRLSSAPGGSSSFYTRTLNYEVRKETTHH